MPSFVIQVKHAPDEVVHCIAALVPTAASGRSATDVTPRKLVVHDGLNDTFEIEVGESDSLVLEASVKENLVYNPDQCSVEIVAKAPPLDEAGGPIGPGDGGEIIPGKAKTEAKKPTTSHR